MAGIWRVIKHGVTDGRDSGYPTINPVGPLFGTRRGAQDEANRLLDLIPANRRTIVVPVKGDVAFRDAPVYEVEKYEVLSQAEADARQQKFVDDARNRIAEKAARLEAEAKALREEISQ